MKYLFLLLFSLLLVGCNSDRETLVLGTDLEDGLLKVYEFEDGTTLYSQFSMNYFYQNDGKLFSLEEALSRNLITVDKILQRTEFYTEANDGGSTVYRYSTEKRKYANRDFTIVKCNTLSGNKDIILGVDLNAIDFCVNEFRKIENILDY